MKRIITPCVVLLLTAGFARADSPAVRVTVQQLLATPQKFAGKRVDVTGFYHTSNGESSLFASERASDQNYGCENLIWLEPDIWDPRYHPHRPQNVAKSEDVERRIVRVIGTFHYQPRPILDKTVPYERRYQGYGSFRMWARAIMDITYFRRAR
jgi:hypothetical protein